MLQSVLQDCAGILHAFLVGPCTFRPINYCHSQLNSERDFSFFNFCKIDWPKGTTTLVSVPLCQSIFSSQFILSYSYQINWKLKKSNSHAISVRIEKTANTGSLISQYNRSSQWKLKSRNCYFYPPQYEYWVVKSETNIQFSIFSFCNFWCGGLEHNCLLNTLYCTHL